MNAALAAGVQVNANPTRRVAAVFVAHPVFIWALRENQILKIKTIEMKSPRKEG